MSTIFGLLKRKRGHSPSASETGSGTSKYELKDKDLGKLHKVAASGDLQKLKKLLKKSDVNQLDKQNRTPLHLACANGHSEIVLLLLQNNFVKLNLCDNDNRSPLMKAVQCQQDACVKALLEHKADPTLVDVNGLTALHQAALIPSCPIAELLLHNNAHIDAQNKDGNTPLLLAVSNSHLPMVELLLRHGANVNSSDRIQRTPLIIAACSGENEIVRVLLKHSANVSCKDEKGWTAEDHARMNEHHACSHLIGEEGARAAQSRMSVGGTARGAGLPELGAAARLGIPAPNKVGEDASHTDTLSRTGATAEEAGGSWPSTDDEDVLDFSPKKPLKPDLSKLLSVSQRLESEGSDPHPVPEQEFDGESGDERKLSGRPLSRASLPSSYGRVRRPPLPSPWLDPPTRPHLRRRKEVDDNDDEDDEEDVSGSDGSLHSDPPSPGLPAPDGHGLRSPRAARRDLMVELGLEDEDADGDDEDVAEDAVGDVDRAAEEKAQEDDEEDDDGQENERWSPSNSEFSEALSDKKEAQLSQKPSAGMVSKLSAIVSSNKQNVIDDLGLDDADDLEDASEWDSVGSRSEASRDAGPSPLKPPRVQTAEGKGFLAGRDAPPSLRAPASPHGDPQSRASRPVQEPPGLLKSGVGSKAVPQENVDGAAEGSDARTLASLQPAALVNTNNNSNSNVFSAKMEHSATVEDKSKFAIDEIGRLDEETFSSDETSEKEDVDVDAINDQMTGGSKPREVQPEPWGGLPGGRHATDVVPGTEEHRRRSGKPDVIGGDGGARSVAAKPLLGPQPATKRQPAASRERTARNGIEGKNITAGLFPAGLDSLTESSDTEDSEGAVSGCLPSSTNPILQGLTITDPAQSARLQEWVAKAERTLEWEKSRYHLLSDKLNQVEGERSALQKALSEMTRSKQALEEGKVNLESDLNALRDSLEQEKENGRGVAKLYETCQAQLRDKEEQLRGEVNAKQKAEHSLQSLRLEKSMMEKRLQLLDKKVSESQSGLEKERTLRLQQEQVLNEQNQQRLQEESERNSVACIQGQEVGQPALALKNSQLQEEISVTKRDMQRQCTSFREREELLMNEKNTLLEQLEALQRKCSVSEDALEQAVQNYNEQLNGARAHADENARRLEQEKVDKERMFVKLEAARKQLAQATSEQASRPEDSGGVGQQQQQRQLEVAEPQEPRRRHDEEVLYQKLCQTERNCSQLESELHRLSLKLMEKEHALGVCRGELDAARHEAGELEGALRAERNETAKLAVREESQRERVALAHTDNQLLHQQLDEANARVTRKDTVVTEIQDRFDTLLAGLRTDKNQQAQVLEERNQELVANANGLRKTIRALEKGKVENESELHDRKQELADALKRLSMSEASLIITTNYRTELETEKTRLQNSLEVQRQQLLEKEREQVRAEQQLLEAQAALEQSRQQAATFAASDQEHACDLDRARRQLDELQERAEREKSRLEEAVGTHAGAVETLQAQLRGAAQDCKSLEETVKQLNEDKNALEEKLQQMESAALAAAAAQEEKVPQRSEPDPQLSQLIAEKAEGAAKLEQKRRRLEEVQGKLERKCQEYADLQEECNRMKSQIKSLRTEREQVRLSRSEGDRSLLHDEPSRHAQEKRLEELTRQLQAAHDTVQSLQRGNRELEEQLRRTKRHLQKQQLTGSVGIQVELQRHKQELEELQRRELASKLQDVNMFLQSQAMSQETLEGLRSMNEIHLKQQMEHKVQTMEAEVERLRSNAMESQRAREDLEAELKRHTSLYQEERSCRNSLSSKLESANGRLVDMSTQLESERQRSSQLMSGRLADSTPFATLLPVSGTGLAQSHGFPQLHQQPRGFRQSHGRPPGLSHSLLSSPADSPSSGGSTHAFYFKMKQELDKSIYRNLDQAYAELNVSSQRFSPLGAAVDAGERDPVARATSQYVDVLHENYRV